MYQGTLCQAIKSCRIVRFNYDGEDRSFLPYIVYKTVQGNALVAGYELGRATGIFRPSENWKQFTVNKITALSITEEPFVPDSSFNPRNKRYSGRIICHVLQYLNQVP